MSQQDVQTIREGYEAFNRKDIPSVLERFDPQIEWTEPGGGRAAKGVFVSAKQLRPGYSALCPRTSMSFVPMPSNSSTPASISLLSGVFADGRKTEPCSTRRSFMSGRCGTARRRTSISTLKRPPGRRRGVDSPLLAFAAVRSLAGT